jgi:hypothetical protein
MFAGSTVSWPSRGECGGKRSSSEMGLSVGTQEGNSRRLGDAKKLLGISAYLIRYENANTAVPRRSDMTVDGVRGDGVSIERTEVCTCQTYSRRIPHAGA